MLLPTVNTTYPNHLPGRLAAFFLIAQFVLIWTTFFVLSSAIQWPQSLGDAADIALPRLLEHQGAVLFGYASYLIAALLLIPATAALNRRLLLSPDQASFLLTLAALSTIGKFIGISRWLFVMPQLAVAYAQPGADTAAIANLFEVFNAYAGGIGEVLGVGLFSGVWTLTLAVFLARHTGAARWLSGYAAFTALLLFLTIPAGFGVELGPMLTVANIAWQFSLLGIGLWALSRRMA